MDAGDPAPAWLSGHGPGLFRASFHDMTELQRHFGPAIHGAFSAVGTRNRQFGRPFCRFEAIFGGNRGLGAVSGTGTRRPMEPQLRWTSDGHVQGRRIDLEKEDDDEDSVRRQGWPRSDERPGRLKTIRCSIPPALGGKVKQTRTIDRGRASRFRLEGRRSLAWPCPAVLCVPDKAKLCHGELLRLAICLQRLRSGVLGA